MVLGPLRLGLHSLERFPWGRDRTPMAGCKCILSQSLPFLLTRLRAYARDGHRPLPNYRHGDSMTPQMTGRNPRRVVDDAPDFIRGRWRILVVDHPARGPDRNNGQRRV
jgi:hypothetical protein